VVLKAAAPPHPCSDCRRRRRRKLCRQRQKCATALSLPCHDNTLRRQAVMSADFSRGTDDGHFRLIHATRGDALVSALLFLLVLYVGLHLVGWYVFGNANIAQNAVMFTGGAMMAGVALVYLR